MADPKLANWPQYDGFDDEAQTTSAWQNPDTGNVLVIERGTGTWKDSMQDFRWFVRVRNAPFWEDDHVLHTIGKFRNGADAKVAAKEYMAEHRM